MPCYMARIYKGKEGKLSEGKGWERLGKGGLSMWWKGEEKKGVERRVQTGIGCHYHTCGMEGLIVPVVVVIVCYSLVFVFQFMFPLLVFSLSWCYCYSGFWIYFYRYCYHC